MPLLGWSPPRSPLAEGVRLVGEVPQVRPETGIAAGGPRLGGVGVLCSRCLLTQLPVAKSTSQVGGVNVARARSASARRRLVAETRLGGCKCTASVGPSPWSMLRSMVMIGVMPLPALMNSSFAGSGSGRVKAPSTPPSRTMTPGRATRTRYGETLPDSTSFGVMLIKPSTSALQHRRGGAAPAWEVRFLRRVVVGKRTAAFNRHSSKRSALVESPFTRLFRR